LWISTNRGLTKFNPVTEKFRNYGTHDGLQSNEFNSGASCKCSNGEMIFGGINGFNIFHPGNVKDNPHIPPVVLTGFQKFNRDVRLDTPLSEIKNLTFSHRDDVFSFEFAALDYSYPEKNSYAYMMEGFEENWNYAGNRRFVTYTNLDPGNYVFRVKGANSDGVWNEAGVSLNITVVPPFWRTWWFALLNTVLIGFIIFVVITRIKTRERKKAEMDRKISDLKIAALSSQMKPHFVFNTINSIQYLISCNNQKAALDYLSKFSRLLRLSLENSRKSNITITDEIKFLELYLQLEKFRSDDKFDYKIELGAGVKTNSMEIPVMCIQPFVENAIVHGFRHKEGRGLITIQFESDHNHIICKIADDGVGIKNTTSRQKKSHNSMGMKITRERLSILNSAAAENDGVEVVDLSSVNPEMSGTRVTLRMPVYYI
jgi:hypothetical protein